MTIFACQCSSYRFNRLPLKVALTGEIFQQEFYKIFKDMSNIFGIADDILIEGHYAGDRDHEIILRHLM